MKNKPPRAVHKEAIRHPQVAAQRETVWRRVLPFAALWALALAAYSNSFQVPLVYDNAVIIGKDVRLRALTAQNVGLIFSKEYWYQGNGSGLYRPFTTLSYLANYSVLGAGDSPTGYHVVNYALHSANACLVFLLGMTMFGAAAPALAMAAIWAVHPALTESVTNIVGRADALAAFGVLAALLCFSRARETEGRSRMLWLAGCAAAAAIGIFSKESAIVVVGAIPLYDLAFPKAQSWRNRLIAYAAAALPCALFLAVRAAVVAQSPAMNIPFTDNPIVGAGFWQGRLTALATLAREILLMIFPLRLSADYSYNAFPLVNGFDARLVVSIIVLAAVAALAVFGWRRNPVVFFLTLFALGALLPTSNLLFPIGAIMADRFLYLPAIAFAGCAAVLLETLRSRTGGRALAAGSAAMVLLFAGRTFARNFDWRTEDDLFRSAEAVVPNSFRPHSALAHGPVDTAAREADAAMRILDPLPDRFNTVAPYLVAAHAYGDMGDSLPGDQGAAWYAKAMTALKRAQHIDQAVNEMFREQDAARGERFQASEWSLIDQEIGHVALRTHDFDESAAATQRAMRLRLAPEMFLDLSTAFVAKNDANDAEITLLEATIWRHQDNAIATQLVKTYSLLSPGSCAVDQTPGGQTRMNFQCPMVESQLCIASSRLVELLDGQHNAVEAARVRTAAQHAGCGR